MRIAAPYAIEFNHKEWLNEYNLIFKPRNKLEDMIRFINDNQDKRLNIWFKDNSFNLEYIKTLDKLHPHIYVVFKDPYRAVMEQVAVLIANNIKFYFDLFASNYSELQFYLSLGCTDIIPAGDLMYDLPNVRSACDKHNANMRIVLNRIMAYPNEFTIKDPFFRPQDVELVEQYFDTAEFTCGPSDFDPTEFDWRTFKVLYRHWFEKRIWIGDLGEINYDITFAFPCRCMRDIFFAHKVKCQLKCYKGSACNHCENYYKMALNLQEKGLAFEDS